MGKKKDYLCYSINNRVSKVCTDNVRLWKANYLINIFCKETIYFFLVWLASKREESWFRVSPFKTIDRQVCWVLNCICLSRTLYAVWMKFEVVFVQEMYIVIIKLKDQTKKRVRSFQNCIFLKRIMSWNKFCVCEQTKSKI